MADRCLPVRIFEKKALPEVRVDVNKVRLTHLGPPIALAVIGATKISEQVKITHFLGVDIFVRTLEV